MDYKQNYNSILSSTVSAIICKTFTNPFERIKVLQQVQTHYNIKYYNNIITSFKYIYKNEAINGLFKGNVINIVRIVPAFILRFEFNNYYNGIFVRPYETPHYVNYLASGVCVGVSQIAITFPLETVRSLRSLDNNMFKNNSLSLCANNIYKKYGLRGFYTGFPVSLLIGGLYTGSQFSLYNYLKANYTENTFVAGAISGIISQSAFYYGDSIKRNMHVNIIEHKYTTVYDCVKHLGIRKLYAGYRINILKCIIETPLQFYIYENMINICNNYNN